ncbi:MAG: GFA family protein [Albimonas sp.]|uniref:GFA family protein n=1 Tax=Albimonas sp. TaxID=1872425 RepID=UPI004056BF7F|tara:strand:- start:994 stop:1380 length:387 start_codon:yes stop_codon:yes gene_type:complete
MTYAGRCQCGACRFEFDGPPNWVAHCHCLSCRRASGAALVSYVGVPDGAWRWTGAEPRAWESSPGTRWLRCPDCGALVAYDAERYGAEIHFPLALIEDPAGLSPEGHARWEERVAWLALSDDLPKESR